MVPEYRQNRRCIACQATGPKVAPEPLRMSELPQRTWQEVSADFKGLCIRWRQLNKAMPRFNPQPYKVVDVNGSMITAQSQTDGHEVMRNSSFMKRLETESSTTSDTRDENQ